MAQASRTNGKSRPRTRSANGSQDHSSSQPRHYSIAPVGCGLDVLEALGKTSGENAYLRVRDGLESETVAIFQPDPGLRVYSEIGKRQPLHAGSSRLLLAHAPEAVQTQVLSQRLSRFTPATRTDAPWIAADLQRIRTRGYLLTTDAVVAGAATVACPVRDASGRGVAVLSG